MSCHEIEKLKDKTLLLKFLNQRMKQEEKHLIGCEECQIIFEGILTNYIDSKNDMEITNALENLCLSVNKEFSETFDKILVKRLERRGWNLERSLKDLDAKIQETFASKSVNSNQKKDKRSEIISDDISGRFLQELSNSNRDIRLSAIKELRNIEASLDLGAALLILLKILKSEDQELKNEAKKTLEEIGPEISKAIFNQMKEKIPISPEIQGGAIELLKIVEITHKNKKTIKEVLFNLDEYCFSEETYEILKNIEKKRRNELKS